ncbi:hypothetical protein vB_RpoS-V16_29 [Ruegeria phage vB_RpoS-V16]|uniref:hypothetical protein n=1 Tax=Ruegeria phage vB_RpoS-V16 TaxID=2218618 RepID=UPI000DCAE1E4|nr:hypothetical protein JT311_gp29 [Ruegeria phage vB_RpoS-V16]AWY09465.1 hypothetical protein vB_RpoS-V16_29 [Ruegeria phage vB_RpoS-V16]
MSENTVIVHGPRGCGKTMNAKLLQAAFGCDAVVDPWHPLESIQEGALHLTSHPEPRDHGIPAGVEVYSFDQAVLGKGALA